MRKIKKIASAVTVAMLILQSVTGVYAGWETDTDKTVNICSTDFSNEDELSTSWTVETGTEPYEGNTASATIVPDESPNNYDLVAPYLIISNPTSNAMARTVKVTKSFTVPSKGIVRASFKYSSDHGAANADIRLTDNSGNGIVIGSGAEGAGAPTIIVDDEEQSPKGSEPNRVFVNTYSYGKWATSYAVGDAYSFDLGDNNWGKRWRNIEVVANTSDQKVSTTIAGNNISLGGGVYAVAYTVTTGETSTNILKGYLPAMGNFNKFTVMSKGYTANGKQTRIDDLSIEYTPVVFVDNKFTNRTIIRCAEEEITDASQLGSEISIESKLFNKSISDKDAAVLAVLYRNGYMINAAAGVAEKVPHSVEGDENIYKQLDFSLITPAQEIFADMSLSVFTIDSFDKIGARCGALNIPEKASNVEFTGETSSPSIDEGTNTLTYCGKTEPDSLVTYAVLKEGKQITDSTSAEEFCDSLYYFGCTESNSVGEYAFDVKFAGTDAEYTLVINDSKEQKSYPLSFKNKLADSIAENLNGVTDKTEFKRKLDSFLESIQFSNNVYNSIINEIKSGDLFYNILFDEIKKNPVSTTDDVVKNAKLSTLMFALGRENEQSSFERLLSENIDMVDVNRMWSNELYSDGVLTDDNVKKTIFARFAKTALNNTAMLSDLGAFVEGIGDSTVLAVCEKTVGAATGKKIIELLNTHFVQGNSSFTAAYTTYSGMSSQQQNTVAAAIMGKNHASIETLVGEFSNAVNTPVQSNSGSHGSVGGVSVKPSPGGSGSGGTSVFNPVVEEKQPALIPPSYEIPQKGEAIEFSDLSEAEWAAEFIRNLSARGVVSGDDNGNFYPNKHILREEFVTMLVKALGIETLYVGSDFIDVPHNAWFYEYVSAAYANGIVNGIDDKHFGAGKYITRQDVCTMLYHALEKYGVYMPKNESERFADDADLSEYARNGVYVLKQLGAVDGDFDGKFEPKRNVSRAETAKILNIVLEYMDNEMNPADKEESDK